MKMLCTALWCFVLCCLESSCQTAAPQYPTDTVMMVLGADTVQIETVRYSAHNVVWLNVHENEGTSYHAADSVLAQMPLGRRIRLMQKGERYLWFRNDTGWCSVDPNRMFTQKGLTENLLLRNGPATPDSIYKKIDSLAKTLIGFIGSPRLIVALHNNTEGNYHVAEYDTTPGYMTRLLPGTDTDDFILTTSENWYKALQTHAYNLAYETAAAADDGSFSAFARFQRLPYLNLEAEHGHKAVQATMVRTVINQWQQGMEGIP